MIFCLKLTLLVTSVLDILLVNQENTPPFSLESEEEDCWESSREEWAERAAGERINGSEEAIVE